MKSHSQTMDFVLSLLWQNYSLRAILLIVISPMVKFHIFRSWSHREQCLNLELAGKAWKKDFAVQ